MDMGVQLMDLRSSMRATQHQGSSDGSRSSSNSTTNHHVVQHLVVQLVQLALRMRQLLLVECAVVGVGQSAAHGTLAAATRRRRQHSLHAIPTLMGAMIQCLWLLWEAAMAGLLMAPLPLVLPPRTLPLPCSHPQPLPSHPPPLGPPPPPSHRHLLLHLSLCHSNFLLSAHLPLPPPPLLASSRPMPRPHVRSQEGSPARQTPLALHKRGGHPHLPLILLLLLPPSLSSVL